MDQSNSRYQPNPGLAAADVPKLKLKWAFGFPNDLQSTAQPAVVGGRVFVGSTGGLVYSLDAASGCIYWTYYAAAPARTGISVARHAGRWIVFIGDLKGFVHALDAGNGKLVWKVRVDRHPAARVTGSPVYSRGRLYVPAASNEEPLTAATPKYPCCTFRGSIAALDAGTGRTIWKAYTVSGPAKPYKVDAEGVMLYGPAGAGVWSAPTIDEAHQRVYVATGNSYTSVELPTGDSIMAFDLQTGRALWTDQMMRGDNSVNSCPGGPSCPEPHGGDYDFGSPPILRLIAGKRILVAGQKSGFVYGMDPDQRGKLLWQIRLGQGSGFLGGIGWGMAADQHAVYAAVADGGRADGWQGIYALELATGKKIWSNQAAASNNDAAQAAAVTAIPGAVFSASFGGHLRAYSTETGQIMWDFDAVCDFPTVNGVPARGGSFNSGGPAVAGGMVFVSSGYGSGGGKPGNVLLAFSAGGR